MQVFARWEGAYSPGGIRAVYAGSLVAVRAPAPETGAGQPPHADDDFGSIVGVLQEQLGRAREAWHNWRCRQAERAAAKRPRAEATASESEASGRPTRSSGRPTRSSSGASSAGTDERKKKEKKKEKKKAKEKKTESSSSSSAPATPRCISVLNPSCRARPTAASRALLARLRKELEARRAANEAEARRLAAEEEELAAEALVVARLEADAAAARARIQAARLRGQLYGAGLDPDEPDEPGDAD